MIVVTEPNRHVLMCSRINMVYVCEVHRTCWLPVVHTVLREMSL